MIPETKAPVRALRASDLGTARPVYVVWELTMKCDQPCQHCGSRAGAARVRELSTAEVLEVGAALARLGCREVALIGGEAYLRTDLGDIVRALVAEGIRVVMQTGGRALTPERAQALAAAGMSGVGVSVDGPAAVHDELRGNIGSHAAAMRALDAAREAGMVVSANSQVNRLNQHHLRDMAAELRTHGIQAWQVQLTVPMGRAADRPDYIIEPSAIVEIIDTLADIQRQAAEAHTGGVPFNIFIGNNIGYYGPHEMALRSRPGGQEAHWEGCQAGISVLGIESDGTIKACPSLPTAPYHGGNVRDVGLETLWESSTPVRFARDRGSEELWGFCATCYYADTCKGGCSWTAHCTLGRRGNNPFCYHRAKQMERRGLRERLELREMAPDQPYDFGRYEIVEEPLGSPEPPPPQAVRMYKRLPIAG